LYRSATEPKFIIAADTIRAMGKGARETLREMATQKTAMIMAPMRSWLEAVAYGPWTLDEPRESRSELDRQSAVTRPRTMGMKVIRNPGSGIERLR